MLAAADEAGVVALFDPTASAEGLPRFSCDAQPHSVTVHDMKWACDDSFFASASADGTLVINSIANSRLVPLAALKIRPTSSLPSSLLLVTLAALAFSPAATGKRFEF